MDGIRRQLRVSHGRLSVLADTLRDTQDQLMRHDFMIDGAHSPRRSASLFKFAPIAEVFTDAVHQYNRELAVFQELLKTVQREQPPRPSQMQTMPPPQMAMASPMPINAVANGQMTQMDRSRQAMPKAKANPMQTQSAQAVPRKGAPPNMANRAMPKQQPRTGAPPNIARKSAPIQQRQSRPPIARQTQPPMGTQKLQRTQKPPHFDQPQQQPLQSQAQPIESQRNFVSKPSRGFGALPKPLYVDANTNGVAQQNTRKPPQQRQQRRQRQPAAAAPIAPPRAHMAKQMQMQHPQRNRSRAQPKISVQDMAMLQQAQRVRSRQTQPEIVVPAPTGAMVDEYSEDRRKPKQKAKKPEKAAEPELDFAAFVPPVLAAQDPDSDGFDCGDHHELHDQNLQFASEATREQKEEEQRRVHKQEAYMATRVKYDDIVLPKDATAKLTYAYNAAGFKVSETELAAEIFTSTRLTLSGVKDMERLSEKSESDKERIIGVLVRECKFKAEHIGEVHIKEGKPFCIVHVRCSLKVIKGKLKKLQQRNNKKKREQQSNGQRVDYSKLVSLRQFVRRPPASDMEANTRLYVLNFDILNKKCHRAMTNLFLRFGDLEKDVVIGLSRDKKDPFAFVEFKDIKDAQKVWKYQNVNGEPEKKIMFGNRALNIQYSLTRPGSRDNQQQRPNSRDNNQQRRAPRQ